MKTIRTSYYSRRDKVVAAQEVSRRMREKWADDPAMLYLADQVEKEVTRMAEGYGGLDTRGATEEVEIADSNRDDAGRALHFHLRAILCSAAHRDAWEDATLMIRVLAADGLSWIHESYHSQTLKTREVLGRFAEMGASVDKCQARVFVDQIASAQAFFEDKLAERGAAVAGKPEILARVTPDFERTLRATLLVLEGRAQDTACAYVLEPFTNLQRKFGPSAPVPEPAPQA